MEQIEEFRMKRKMRWEFEQSNSKIFGGLTTLVDYLIRFPDKDTNEDFEWSIYVSDKKDIYNKNTN